MTDISELEAILQYVFTKKHLLHEALTHPSTTKKRKNNEKRMNYERLEFLGNGVVNLVLADMVYHYFPDADEGVLSIVQSKLAKTECLAIVAREIKLGRHIIMDHGEKANGGKNNSRNLENCLEAVIGAIYLDGGYDVVVAVIERLWKKQVQQSDGLKDAKSRLQEICQQNGVPMPKYEVLKQDGEAHMPIFFISCSIIYDNKKIVREASGRSKKEAEQKVAEAVLLAII